MLDIVRSIYAIVENENRKCSACKMVRNSAYDMSPKRFVYFSSVDVKIFPTILILVIFFFYNAMTYTLMHIVNRTRQAYNLFESRWVPENNIDSDSIDSDEQSKIRSFFFLVCFRAKWFSIWLKMKMSIGERERKKEKTTIYRNRNGTEISLDLCLALGLCIEQTRFVKCFCCHHYRRSRYAKKFRNVRVGGGGGTKDPSPKLLRILSKHFTAPKYKSQFYDSAT